ncbi:MAG TPA: 50S ribosomal protein L25 [Pseudomonadota bacterium]|nr:50S ribosomal protein L25 [Pseudomonadota bacterium]
MASTEVSTVGTITAQLRPQTGKENNTKLRQKGSIPAVCYGGSQAPLALQLSPHDLQKSLDPVKGRNTLLMLTVEGQTGTIPVMLKDTQKHVLRGHLLHADLLRVDVKKPVRATIPVAVTGKSPGIAAGGTLHQVYRTLPISSLPGSIPAKIEIDVSSLNIGQAIHASDVKLPEGVTIALAANTTVCVVTAPKSEKAAEAAATPDAAAAAAAGEAKPAGDKAGAKTAAAKTAAPAAAKAGGDKAPAKPAAGGKK